MKICLAQINTTVADFDGNVARILDAVRSAESAGAQAAVFPEMCLTSYPPRDLLLRESFVRAGLSALDRLASKVGDVWVVVGFVSKNETGRGKPLRNSVAVIHGGRVVEIRHKTLLPTYDVFDESRYFEPAETNEPVVIAGRRVGLTICEDAWARYRGPGAPAYAADPVRSLCDRGAEIILNISASPFTLGKGRIRSELLAGHARSCRVPIVYVNQAGGNDELVFDGDSRVFGPDGSTRVRGKLFEEDIVTFDLDHLPQEQAAPELDDTDAIRRALTLGIRDFVRKCGFTEVVIGLSGGIDSSVTAALAADALGPRNVVGVWMPSVYSSDQSREDAEALARNLGIRFEVIPIHPAHDALTAMLGGRLDDSEMSDITRQNVQARVRGTVLMALSNRYRWMVLATGNKSELATGYCTLYGDMCGALAPLGDVFKTRVFALARHINAGRPTIPERVIIRPPTAELKPNQTDQDTLPPYDLLDKILEAYVEQELGEEEIVAMGFRREIVEDVVRRIAASEHKRRQAPPCIKVSLRAFGLGRRLPIARRMP